MSDEAKKAAGQLLKAERERLGLSLQDISTATKINAKIIHAIEEANLEALPAKPFARGFLRTYAQYLKMNPQPLVDAFALEDAFLTNDGRVTPDQIGSPPSPTDETVIQMQSNKIGAKVLYVVGILLLIGLIFGIKKIVNKYAQERETTEIQVPVENVVDTSADIPSADVANIDAADTDDTAKTEAGATDKAPMPTLAPSAAPSAAPTSAPTEMPKPTTTPKASPTPAPTPTVNPIPTPAAKATPAPTKTVSAKVSQEIIIEALDQVKVQVRVDGDSKTTLELKPESVHTIKATESVELEISDGGLVNIIQNGKDRGNPGDLGKPVKIKFP